MLASELSANTSTTKTKHTSTVRMVRRNVRSLICGKFPLMMLSLKATDGASSVALEQLMIAESTAPKKIIWAKTGVCSRISVGSTSCGSLCSNAPNISGYTRVGEQASNIGTKANGNDSGPPSTDPGTAARSRVGEVKPWHTSVRG